MTYKKHISQSNDLLDGFSSAFAGIKSHSNLPSGTTPFIWAIAVLIVVIFSAFYFNVRANNETILRTNLMKSTAKVADNIEMRMRGISASMARMIEKMELDGYQSIYIDCIAKNFETLEPGIAFRVLRQYLERRYGAEGAAKRIFATGTPGSTLHQLCLDQGYTFLTFPETIGGRYSVGSDVGLFPMAVAGVDIRALVQGMRDMRDPLLAAPAEENPALRYACLRRLLLEHGYRLEMLSFFEPRLDYFAKWWIQLFAESEGKEGNALYPVAASNSEDLHSIGQFIQEGSPILFETFVEVRARDASVLLPPEAKKDYFDYLTGMDFWDINNTARQATMRAHGDRGIPCMNLSIPAIDAHTLGGLFYFFLFACYLSCKLLGVNPFNQPGVEGYKGYMFQNLGKPGVN